MVRVLDIYLVYYEWQCLILFTQYIIIYKYHPPSAIQGISKFPLLAPQFAWLSPTRTPTSSRPNSSPVPVASLNKSFSLVTPRWSFNWLLNHWMIFYGWNIRSNPVAWNMTKTSKASTTNQGNFSCFPFYAPPPSQKKKTCFSLEKKSSQKHNLNVTESIPGFGSPFACFLRSFHRWHLGPQNCDDSWLSLPIASM